MNDFRDIVLRSLPIAIEFSVIVLFFMLLGFSANKFFDGLLSLMVMLFCLFLGLVMGILYLIKKEGKDVSNGTDD